MAKTQNKLLQKNDDNIAMRRQRLLILQMSVGRAYKPHNWEIHHLNTRISVLAQTEVMDLYRMYYRKKDANKSKLLFFTLTSNIRTIAQTTNDAADKEVLFKH